MSWDPTGDFLILMLPAQFRLAAQQELGHAPVGRGLVCVVMSAAADGRCSKSLRSAAKPLRRHGMR